MTKMSASRPGPFGWKLYYFLLFFTSWVQELFWLMLDIQGQHACLAPSLLQAVQVNSHEEEHGEDEQYTFRDLSSARNEAAVHPFRRIRAAYLQRVSTWADALRRVLDNGVALPVLPQHAQVPSPGGWLPSPARRWLGNCDGSFWTSAKPSPVFVWLTAAKATGHRTVDCASSFPWRASRSATITTEGAMLRESWCLHRLQSYRILAFAALP